MRVRSCACVCVCVCLSLSLFVCVCFSFFVLSFDFFRIPKSFGAPLRNRLLVDLGEHGDNAHNPWAYGTPAETNTAAAFLG